MDGFKIESECEKFDPLKIHFKGQSTTVLNCNKCTKKVCTIGMGASCLILPLNDPVHDVLQIGVHKMS